MIDYTHDNLVSAAEKLLAKVSEVFTHKDLQCCLAIAGIHGYVAHIPSLQEEGTALENAIKESKAKLTAEAKAELTKTIDEVKGVAEKVGQTNWGADKYKTTEELNAIKEAAKAGALAPVIAADFTKKSLIKK